MLDCLAAEPGWLLITHYTNTTLQLPRTNNTHKSSKNLTDADHLNLHLENVKQPLISYSISFCKKKTRIKSKTYVKAWDTLWVHTLNRLVMIREEFYITFSLTYFNLRSLSWVHQVPESVGRGHDDAGSPGQQQWWSGRNSTLPSPTLTLIWVSCRILSDVLLAEDGGRSLGSSL